MIVEVISHYHPEWDPPDDDGSEWVECLCPFHAEENPSAAVSYTADAFNCFGCDWSGDSYEIIKREEGVRFGEAKRIAARIVKERGDTLRRPDEREPVGNLPSEPGLIRRPFRPRSKKVQARARRRPLEGI